MASPNRVAANKYMGKLLKRRGCDRKTGNVPEPMNWKWLMSICRPGESPRSTIAQGRAGIPKQ
jgi:hypothetical protein